MTTETDARKGRLYEHLSSALRLAEEYADDKAVEDIARVRDHVMFVVLDGLEYCEECEAYYPDDGEMEDECPSCWLKAKAEDSDWEFPDHDELETVPEDEW